MIAARAANTVEKGKELYKDRQKQQAASGAPNPDQDPDDEDKWTKNKDGRWHHEDANDIDGIHNRPNFKNKSLQNAAEEIYRFEDTKPGGSAGKLIREKKLGSSAHLIKCEQRMKQLQKILTDSKENISRLDRESAERLIDYLREAIKK